MGRVIPLRTTVPGMDSENLFRMSVRINVAAPPFLFVVPGWMIF